jgi:hypothetical protein
VNAFLDTLVKVLGAAWLLLEEMSPYLLLGFLMAGLLRAALTPAMIRRHMGRPGLGQILKASLIGVPLPLCSCGVIPVGLSIRRQGGSRGATAAFLAATPQTSVTSIVATWALLGPIVTFVRILAAVLSGVLAGLFIEWTYPHEASLTEEDIHGQPTDTPAPTESFWRKLWRHGFVVLPRDIARPFAVGLLLAALLTVLIPPGFFQGRVPSGLLSYMVMLAVGLPIYVCSTGSLPLALSFLHMGFSPGSALVFLVAGPATNAATLATLWTRIGRRGTLLYLLAIAIAALFAGFLTDLLWRGEWVHPLSSAHAHHAPVGEWRLWLSRLGGAALLLLLLPGLWERNEDET